MMHWKIRREFLQRVEIFANLGRRELKAVARSCQESEFEDGEYLCRQGERGVAAYLIISGKVDVVDSEQDRDFVITTLGQGTFVGELAIIDGAARVASIRAKGRVKSLVLTQWAMQGLLNSKPTIAVAMLPIVVKRFRQTTEELRRHNSASQAGRTSVFQ